MIFPPILSLKLNKAELALENGAFELVKGYTNDFIEYFIENKKKRMNIIKYYDFLLEVIK